MTAGPTELRHRERERTITLEIRPAPGMALESALDILRADVIAPLESEGLPAGHQASSVRDRRRARKDLGRHADPAPARAAIVYLVMAVLFESFVYPLVILLSVPVAAAGGVAGLAVVNASPSSRSTC